MPAHNRRKSSDSVFTWSAGTIARTASRTFSCRAARPRTEFKVRLNSSSTFRSRTVLAVAGRPSGREGCRYRASSFRRITVAAPGIGVASNCSEALTGAVSLPAPWKTRIELPTRIWSPCASTRSMTGTPLTKVLLRLSRSTSRKPFASLRMRQWRRETRESSSEISLEGSRPIETSSLVRGNSFPLRGPLTTSNRAPLVGETATSPEWPMTQ
jgi:hypothetical protein